MNESVRGQERYLRAIMALSRKYFCVRSVDVAHYMACSRATVSVMVKQLALGGLLEISPDGALSLTEAGESRILRYDDRCSYFQQLLERAGIAADDEEREGSALAGGLSHESYERLREYLNEK